MFGIVLLLLAGAYPVLSQQFQHFQQNRFSDYGDYGGYYKGEQRGSDFGLQQRSFYGLNNNNGESVETSGNSGATGLSAPESTENSNNNQQYFNNPRHAIVPSSLRELEESYIRSLSTSSTTQPYLDPFGENREVLPQPQQHPRGVERFSGFSPTNRRQPFVHSHYNKNEHEATYRNQQFQLQQQQQHQQQQPRQQSHQNRAQSAPITYGFPLVNQQISATNSLETPFDQNHQVSGEGGRFYDYPEKNNVPNFPDFSGPPPIPEEPYIPPASELETTGTPPEKLLVPTPTDLNDYGSKVSPPPLASPPPEFDPTFPKGVIQRGFIPSFGPPTKVPLGKHGSGKDSPVISEPVHNHLQAATHHQSEVNSSPIPILRPEYPRDNEKNILPDELGSDEGLELTAPQKGKVYKHISVHVAAEDLDEDVSAPKVVKIAKKPEKHLKVIFIKPPETPTPKTEVEVPPSPEHRTLVYLLSESGGARAPIKLIKTPLKPTPPQVFFLRYKDPSTGASHPHLSSERGPSSQPQPSSESADDSSDGEEPTGPPPDIKDLSSPIDPDAELLRSAPAPVIPTFTSFSNPTTTAISQLALTSLTSPTAFTNYNNPNANYLTSLSPTPINNDNNNHLTAFTTTNPTNFPNTMQPPPPVNVNTNPFSQNYYSSLYHLYPPPQLTSAIPNQNLGPIYFNPIQQQFHQPPFIHSPYNQFFNVDQSKSGTESHSSSIQGLYSVAPYVQNLQGINYNSLLQKPDGKRPARNFVMMTYAPTYTPTASGSEHAPVFTSPADFIKSLLGDSYMYYNHIGNNTLQQLINKNISSSTRNVQTLPIPIATIIKAYDHTHSATNNGSISQHPSEHLIPLVLNLEHLQNLSRPPDHHKQSPPYTVVLGSSYGTSERIKSHVHRSADNYPGPQSFTSTSTTTTTHQPRISSPIVTTTVLPGTTSTTTTRKHTMHIPVVIYDTSKESHATPRTNVTTAESVKEHFSKILQSIDFNKNNGSLSETESEEGSFSGHPGSSSNSEETREIAQLSTESNEEEVIPIYFEPSKSNSSSIINGTNNGTIVFVNNNNNSTRPGNGKRVNPAQVKPGRRLRKVRKPPKVNKNKSGESEQ